MKLAGFAEPQAGVGITPHKLYMRSGFTPGVGRHLRCTRHHPSHSESPSQVPPPPWGLLLTHMISRTCIANPAKGDVCQIEITYYKCTVLSSLVSQGEHEHTLGSLCTAQYPTVFQD